MMILINFITVGLFLFIFPSEAKNSVATFPLYLSSSISSSNDITYFPFINNDTRHHFSPLHVIIFQGYYVTLNIGTPSQQVNVLVDTGSSNFAVGAVPNHIINRFFNPDNSSTFQKKDVNITVHYTKGSWEGFLGTDQLLLPNFPPVWIDIACITESDNFFINSSEWEGILGLGYSAIAKPYNVVKPLFDTMVQAFQFRNVFSIQLFRLEDDSDIAGMLSLGGFSQQYKPNQIYYTPLHREWYYDIVLTEISVGNKKIMIDCKELNNNKTIVDSGTTNLCIPRKVFELLIKLLQEQMDQQNILPDNFWEGSSFLCLTNKDTTVQNFPKIRLSVIHSSNSTFTLVFSYDQYLRKVTDNNQMNIDCYVFAISPSDSGTVIGAVIMQGYLVVFDRENKRIGFADSDSNHNSSSTSYTKIEGPFYHSDPWSCAYEYEANSSTQLILYFSITLAVICIIPLIILIVCKIKTIWHRKRDEILLEQ